MSKTNCSIHNYSPNTKELCIKKVPIFNHLEEKEMMKIMELSTNKVFKKGELIYQSGDPLEYIYIVHRGRVKVYQLFESGKEHLLHIIEQGEFMGELSLFANKTIDNFAEAMIKTDICMIHKNDIQQLIIKHPTIGLKILEQFSLRLEKTEKLIGQLSSKDVEKRAANYLLELAKEKEDATITLPMSKKDLASYLGTTQETISRRLSSFQEKGWIDQVGQRKITILNKQALADIGTN